MSANFAHAAFDNPKESFGQVAVTLLGPKGFPKTKYGALFKRECRKVSAMHSQWKRVYEISVAIAVALTLAACASTDPQSPHPEGFPGD
ncbi:MAG TPA: hypothetical protein VGR03_09300, partial [Candidatus Acidoferrum sp.]|nr:hypothetical protein [Candidatus Acidoferrum sp.]